MTTEPTPLRTLRGSHVTHLHAGRDANADTVYAELRSHTGDLVCAATLDFITQRLMASGVKTLAVVTEQEPELDRGTMIGLGFSDLSDGTLLTCIIREQQNLRVDALPDLFGAYVRCEIRATNAGRICLRMPNATAWSALLSQLREGR